MSKFQTNPLRLPLACLATSLLVAGCAAKIEKPNEIACEGEATYQVTFNSTWTSNSHPKDFPEKPHYSHLFGASHNYEVTFWEPGGVANKGVKDIAETGMGLNFFKKVKRAIFNEQALEFVEGNEMPLSPGISQAEFQVSGEYSRVTFLNMLAPSPDWITGVSSLNLCSEGTWIESKTVSAQVYDGGTDDGETYTAKDLPRAEYEPIALLSGSGRSAYGEFADVGTFEFKKIK